MRTAQPRPDYDKLVDRILAVEISRQEAADLSFELTGLKPQTFLSWLRSSGKLDMLKPTRANAGANSQFAHTNPDKVKAYEDALALALTGKVSIRAAALKFDVSYPYLLKKARKAGLTQAKEAQVTPHTPEAPQENADEDLVRAILADPAKVRAFAMALREVST